MTIACKFFVCLLLLPALCKANDSAYLTRGNQLIPMTETIISIRKEVLSIRRKDKDKVEVDVYYEFFNPESARVVVVGFEAKSPQGDVNASPVNGKHPYIHDFTISMNNAALPYSVAIVTTRPYYKNGKFMERSLAETMKRIEDHNVVDFDYVYYFKGNFKFGTNIVRHTYTFDLSASMDLHYDFAYVLSNTNLWGNRPIDDFTLKIDMGNFEDFYMKNSFFTSVAEWKIDGDGKKEYQNGKPNTLIEEHCVHFMMRKGKIVFKKLNFQPKEDLFLFSVNCLFTSDIFNPKTDKLPLSLDFQERIPTGGPEAAVKILRNLPFARRGLVFTNPELKKYYESLSWYSPDPTYVPKTAELTKEEKDWLMTLGNAASTK